MARITSKQAQEMMDAYANVYANKEEPVTETSVAEETPVEDIQERTRLKDRPQVQALRDTAKPFMNQGKVTVSSNNSSGTPQQVPNGGNSGGTPVNQLFGRGGSDGSPAAYTGGPSAAQRANAAPAPQAAPQKMVGGQGNRQRPVKTGGIQLGKSISGGLSSLGNLAGRAVGGIKQGAQAAAGGIKQGVQAAAGGIKQGAQAVAGALQNKGPIQGRASGPQRRAQQSQQRQAAPQAAPGRAQAQAAPQAKPTGQATPTAAQTAAAKADTTSPAAKAGLSSNMRAQAAANNANFQANRASQTPMDRRNARLAAMKNKGRPLARLNNEYDPMEDVFDDTINFLVSEGYVSNEAEALTVMAEQEFIDSFTEGYQQVINEEAQK